MSRWIAWGVLAIAATLGLTPVPSNGAAPTPSPQVVLEGVAHTVGSTVVISGAIRNVGQEHRTYVDVVVSAQSSPGYLKSPRTVEKRADVTNLGPGGVKPFRADLGRDLLASYTVRVDRYFRMQPGEPLGSVSGTIPMEPYLSWQSENLTGAVLFEEASVRQGGSIEVSASRPSNPYARVFAIVLRVDWIVSVRTRRTDPIYPFGREVAHLIGDTQVVVAPPNWRATIPLGNFPVNEFFVSGSARARAVQVMWVLNF